MINYIKTDGIKTVGASIEVALLKEGDYIVAYCQALELSSYGVTEKEAKEGFEGALTDLIAAGVSKNDFEEWINKSKKEKKKEK